MVDAPFLAIAILQPEGEPIEMTLMPVLFANINPFAGVLMYRV